MAATSLNNLRILLPMITGTHELEEALHLIHRAWWPYVRDALPLVLENGVLNFSTDYTLNLAKDTELEAFRVAQKAVAEKAGVKLTVLPLLLVTRFGSQCSRFSSQLQQALLINVLDHRYPRPYCCCQKLARRHRLRPCRYRLPQDWAMHWCS